MGLMRYLRGRVFCLYICINMGLCAIVFLPWVKPRETISGLVGRWYIMSDSGSFSEGCAYCLKVLIDAIYFWEFEHCVEVYKSEHLARKALYPEHS